MMKEKVISVSSKHRPNEQEVLKMLDKATKRLVDWKKNEWCDSEQVKVDAKYRNGMGYYVTKRLWETGENYDGEVTLFDLSLKGYSVSKVKVKPMSQVVTIYLDKSEDYSTNIFAEQIDKMREMTNALVGMEIKDKELCKNIACEHHFLNFGKSKCREILREGFILNDNGHCKCENWDICFEDVGLRENLEEHGKIEHYEFGCARVIELLKQCKDSHYIFVAGLFEDDSACAYLVELKYHTKGNITDKFIKELSNKWAEVSPQIVGEKQNEAKD